MRRTRFAVAALTLLAIAAGLGTVSGRAWAQGDPPPEKRGGRGSGKGEGKGKGKERSFPAPEQAWKVATIILGCPARDRISMSVYPAADLQGYVEYGVEGKPLTGKIDTRDFKAEDPTLVTLTGLAADTAYTYRFRYRKPGETEFQTGPECRFHTQRAPGSAFTFEIQGDSHPERTPKQNDPVLYAQTLSAVAKDRPDFYLCIGDDFSVDTLPEVNAESVKRVYLKQLPYLGLVAHSSALFLVNGNHEQAARYNLDGTADNVAVWAQTNRNRLYPQPAPDDFYTGDAEEVKHIGLLRDYYAWTWGDALFVVIDPYWHSEVPVDNEFGADKKKERDLWQIGLGDAQYKWFRQTLEQSHARFKFVFSHHVLGTGRGGIERAGEFEWGGKGRRGGNEFSTKRPGWELPIHQLMVRNKVSVFFQGHDHIFARQELDGVVYLTLPDPGNSSYVMSNQDAYLSGDLLPGSGRVRVSVAPDKVRIEYVRSWLPRDATKEHPDGETAFSFEIPGKPR